MKTILTGLVLFGAVLLNAQQLEVGDQVPEFTLELPGNDQQSLSSSDLKGQVILIDFWGTYCSPCVKGMPHLEDLQAEFDGQLTVIAVNYEGKERLERFLTKKSFDFTFVLGSDQLREFFPFRSIPHTVLIDDVGKVVAITSPENITSEVIA